MSTDTVSPITIVMPAPNVARRASLAYVAVWILGLFAAPAAPAMDADTRAVIAFHESHRLVVLVQSLLVHGVAAVMLALLLLTARRGGRLGRVAPVAGLVAVTISAVQCVLGGVRSVSSGGRFVSLVDAINRLDGLKMVALAVMMITGTLALFHRSPVGLPMFLLGMIGGVTAMMSAVGYLFLLPGPASVAFVSLPLLLAWVWRVGRLVPRVTGFHP